MVPASLEFLTWSGDSSSTMKNERKVKGDIERDQETWMVKRGNERG